VFRRGKRVGTWVIIRTMCLGYADQGEKQCDVWDVHLEVRLCVVDESMEWNDRNRTSRFPDKKIRREESKPSQVLE